MALNITQMVKNLPAMWETQSRSLGGEDPLEKGKATHSSILACRILVAKSWTRLSDSHFTSLQMERDSCWGNACGPSHSEDSLMVSTSDWQDWLVFTKKLKEGTSPVVQRLRILLAMQQT